MLPIQSIERSMSSREIAELTGKEHANVKRDIKAMVLQLNYPDRKLKDCPNFDPSQLKGHNITISSYEHSGNPYTEFLLDYSDTLLLTSGYRVVVRKAIITRWRELESAAESTAVALPNFNDPAAAARAWASQFEEKTAALQVIEEQAPKVEFYDQVTDSTDAIDMASAAKVLNIKGYGRNKLFAFLREKKVLQDNNQPYQSQIDSNRMRVIESRFVKPNGDICINLKTVVYQRGLDHIRKLIAKG